TPHSHGPNLEKLAAEKVIADMKKRCERQLPYAAFQPSSHVVTDSQIAEPPRPTSLQNLGIPDKYGKLCTGESLLQVQSSVLDFETGLVPAVQDEFPLPSMKGCNFHFNQALYRNLQNLGLQQEYVDDKAVRKYYRKNLKYQKPNRTVQRITDHFNLGLTQPLDYILAIGRCFAAAGRA
ncbi:unnamed protein product, partial [Didymodactylos carnosus]